ELVCLLASHLQRFLKGVAEGTGRRDLAEPEPHHLALTGVHRQPIMRRDLGAFLFRVHGHFLAVDDVVIDAVLDIRRPVGDAEDPLAISLVLGEEQRRFPIAVEVSLPQFGINGLDDTELRSASDLVQTRAIGAPLPGPLVAEPERWQYVQLGWLRAAVVNADLD